MFQVIVIAAHASNRYSNYTFILDSPGCQSLRNIVTVFSLARVHVWNFSKLTYYTVSQRNCLFTKHLIEQIESYQDFIRIVFTLPGGRATTV